MNGKTAARRFSHPAWQYGLDVSCVAAALATTYSLEAEIAAGKRGEEALQERARLLDLTHDTVFVRDLRDVITFWNRHLSKCRP